MEGDLETEVIYEVTEELPYRDFEILSCEGFKDSRGYYHVKGELKNTGDEDAKNVEIFVTFWAEEWIVGVESNHTAPNDLSSGEKGSFDIVLLSEYYSEEVVRYVFSPQYKQSSQISCHLSSTSIVLGESVTISGFINPARSATVTIEIYRDSSPIETETEWAPGGSYSYTWTPTEVESYKVEASWNGDDEYLG